MTCQTNPASSGFRELTPEELLAVSGGNAPLISSTGITVYGGSTAGTTSSGAYQVGNGDGAGGIGSGLSSFQMMDLALIATIDAQAIAEFDPQKAFADYLKEHPLEEQWIDADGDGLHDITGEGRPIVVTGDTSRVAGTPEGYIRAPGAAGEIYMYPVDVNGNPDYSQPPRLTPEGEARACETYREAQAAISLTSAQLTGVTGSTGYPSFWTSPGAWFLGLVGGGSLAIQSQVPPPDHCQ